MNIIRVKASTYLITTLVLTALVVFLIHRWNLESFFYRYTVVLPGITALIFLCFSKLSDISHTEFFNQFKISKRTIKWLLFSLFFYTLLSYLALGISKFMFQGHFIWIPSFKIPLSKIGLIFVLAFFEEIGWRGFALPQLLKKFNFIQASMFIGVIWALWHFPGYLVGFGAPNDIPFWVFSLWVVGSAFIFTWLYIKSNRNVWTAVVLHFGANMALQLYPIMPFPAGTNATFYCMTAVVIGLAIFISIKLNTGNHESKF